jgi:hypothetical protein
MFWIVRGSAILQASYRLLELVAWLQLVTVGVLCIVVIELLVWLDAGAAVVALHVPVLAAMILRRAGRLTSGVVAPDATFGP